MKTNNKIVIISFLVILFSLTTMFSVNALQSNGTQGLGKTQNHMNHNNGGNGKHLGNKAGSNNEYNIIKSIPKSDLTEQEKKDLYYQYNEEKVAYDIYSYFYDKYGVKNFQNIASSEKQHMDAVKILLDRYELDIPTNYSELQSTFDSLKSEGEKGLKEALEVGLKIEMLDIKDITETIKTTDNDDIKIVLINIGGASYNHMRGFLQGLKNNGLTTTIDYSTYLDTSDLDSKGTLKTKLSEKLEKEGVILPLQAKDKAIQESCDKEQKQSEQIEKNKKNIDKKYGKKLKEMNIGKLNNLNKSLENAINNLENKEDRINEKEKDNLNIYYALKEYINEFKK